MEEFLAKRVKVHSEPYNSSAGIILIDSAPMYYIGWDNPKRDLGNWVNSTKARLEIIEPCKYDERILHTNLMVRSRTLHCYDDLTVPRVGDRIEYIGEGFPFIAVVLKAIPKFSKPPIFVVGTEKFIPELGSYVVLDIGPFCFKKIESMSKEEMLTHSLPEIRRIVTGKQKPRTML